LACRANIGCGTEWGTAIRERQREGSLQKSFGWLDNRAKWKDLPARFWLKEHRSPLGLLKWVKLGVSSPSCKRLVAVWRGPGGFPISECIDGTLF
jgi:hypothetical protein